MLTKPLPGVGYILLEEGEPSNSYKQVYGLLAALDIHFHPPSRSSTVILSTSTFFFGIDQDSCLYSEIS